MDADWGQGWGSLSKEVGEGGTGREVQGRKVQEKEVHGREMQGREVQGRRCMGGRCRGGRCRGRRCRRGGAGEGGAGEGGALEGAAVYTGMKEHRRDCFPLEDTGFVSTERIHELYPIKNIGRKDKLILKKRIYSFCDPLAMLRRYAKIRRGNKKRR